MVNKKRLAFLFSKANNWIEPYIRNASFKKEWSGTIDFFYEKEHISGYDIVFILGYTQILSDDFLGLNDLNLVIHESAVPFGKGFSPIQWQILKNADEILVTLLEASKIVDSGDIILQENLVFDGSELYGEIRDKQAACSISLITKFLNKYPVYEKKKQALGGITFPRRGPQDSILCLHKTIEEQFNLLRVGNNDQWPSFFIRNGHKYIVKIYKEN
jgi:methionyl-tRNA formyltransferase